MSCSTGKTDRKLDNANVSPPYYSRAETVFFFSLLSLIDLLAVFMLKTRRKVDKTPK